MLAAIRCKLEVIRQNIIDQVVKVVSLNKSLALVARIHGYPAELVTWYLSLHEVPHLPTHHGNWVHGGKEEELARLINFVAITEELTCEGKM